MLSAKLASEQSAMQMEGRIVCTGEEITWPAVGS